MESGETMRAAKLHAIATLVESQAVLISNPKKSKGQESLIQMIKRNPLVSVYSFLCYS